MKKLIVLLTLITLTIFSCHHHIDDITDVGNGQNGGNNNNGGGNNDTTTYVNPHPCDPDSVYFVNDILPLINSSCAMSGCHDANAGGDDQDPYTTYSQINQHRNSMLSEMLQGSMPPWNSGITLTDAQIQMFQTWISQGHLNNQCIEDCDPNAVVTFSSIVQPIIETNCTGCHSGDNPSGGVLLTDYSTISDCGLNGELMNSLNHTNGVSLMPPNSSGLPTCVIGQIQTWVDNGAPNN